MDNQMAQLVDTHIRLQQAVPPGGALREMDMFANNPVQLEAVHPPLTFLTPVGRNKERSALNGRWIRLSGVRKLQLNGAQACIRRRYKFVWTHGINPRPRFEMQEYMRSTQGKRAICVVQRVAVDEMVQEQEQGQDQNNQENQAQEVQQEEQGQDQNNQEDEAQEVQQDEN